MHWQSRGPHESSSRFGQWVHDELSKTFWLVDDDIRPNHWAMIKRSSRIYREVEHKFTGQTLKESERTLMRLRAIGIQHLITRDVVSPFSGAFVVWSDPPFRSAVAERVSPSGDQGLPIRLSGDQVEQFIGCWGSTDFQRREETT